MRLNFICTLLVSLAAGSAHYRLFYIYDFPDIVVHPWPARGIPLEGRSVWKHHFNENEGFGHHYNGTEYFETWQYSSFQLILSRLLRSKYRTRDPDEASMFFIPYDSGADAYASQSGQYRVHGIPALSGWVLEHLSLLPRLKRFSGFDHFYVHSSSLTAHIVTQPVKKLLEICGNATILTVEKFPALPKRLAQLPFIQPIPMPSMYHWRNGPSRRSFPALTPLQAKRGTLISFFGAANTATPESNKLRLRLFDLCERANKSLPPDSNAQYNTVCEHSLFAPSQNRDTVDALGILSAYERSIYCLCPPGDSPIRRAIFDAILAGCIPVLFSTRLTPRPLHQYNWHLSDDDINSTVVLLDATSTHKIVNIDYIEQLILAFSPSDVRKMQKAIATLSRRLQYSMPTDVQQFGFPVISDHLTTWDPPFPDAVDIILDEMFRKVNKYIPVPH